MIEVMRRASYTKASLLKMVYFSSTMLIKQTFSKTLILSVCNSVTNRTILITNLPISGRLSIPALMRGERGVEIHCHSDKNGWWQLRNAFWNKKYFDRGNQCKWSKLKVFCGLICPNPSIRICWSGAPLWLALLSQIHWEDITIYIKSIVTK